MSNSFNKSKSDSKGIKKNDDDDDSLKLIEFSVKTRGKKRKRRRRMSALFFKWRIISNIHSNFCWNKKKDESKIKAELALI
jgi:hypothetical protein